MIGISFIMIKSKTLEGILNYDTLEKLSVIPYTIGAFVSGASNLTDFPGSENMGDYIHIGCYSMIAAYIGHKFDNYGDRKDSKIAKKIGKYFSDVTIPLLTAAFVIGETVHDWIPLNVMDSNDIYAAIGAGILGTFYARSLQNSKKQIDGDGKTLQTIKN